MSKYFSEKDIENFRQCFKLYATEGVVTTPQKLGFIMRSLNMKPTVKELSTYYNNFKKEDGQIDFADFLNIIHAHLQNEAASDEVIKAFRVYDQNKTGFISIKELRAILTTTGERLSNRDVDMILQEVNATKDGKVKYEDIAKILSTPIADY